MPGRRKPTTNPPSVHDAAALKALETRIDREDVRRRAKEKPVPWSKAKKSVGI